MTHYSVRPRSLRPLFNTYPETPVRIRPALPPPLSGSASARHRSFARPDASLLTPPRDGVTLRGELLVISSLRISCWRGSTTRRSTTAIRGGRARAGRDGDRIVLVALAIVISLSMPAPSSGRGGSMPTAAES